MTQAPVGDGSVQREPERCEIEARRISEPAFGGEAIHEFRAVVDGPAGPYIAERVRYKGSHAVDLEAVAHRSAFDSLVSTLESSGWVATADRGHAEYSRRFTRAGIAAPLVRTEPERSKWRVIVEWYEGLTKHTKRLAILFGISLVAAVVIDAAAGAPRLLSVWPSLLSTSVALVWILAATDDFRGGTHRRIARRVASDGAHIRQRWYRMFITHVVLPNRAAIGWAIPGSMYCVALAYLSGVWVLAASVGALFLLANMFIFLDLRYPRDDFVSLTVAQFVILFTQPGGVPALFRALGLT